MKRITSIFTFVCAFVLGAWMISQVMPNLAWLTASSFQSELKYENINKAVSDGRNYVYTIDKSLKRVMMVDSRGNVGFIIEVPYDSPINYSDIAVDDSGNVYISSFGLNDQGVRIAYEHIDQYNVKGKKIKTIYSIDYDAQQMPTRPEQINGLTVNGTTLSFYRSVGAQISNYRLNTSTGDAALVAQFYVPDGLYPFHFSAMSQDQTVYFTTKKAEIYRYQVKGAMQPIYSADANAPGSHSFPLHLVKDTQDRIYYGDIGLKQVVRLDQQTGATLPVLTESMLKANGHSVSLTSMKTISIQADGALSIALNDRVITLTPQFQLDQVITGGSLIFEQMLPRWIVRAEVILIGIILIYLLYVIYVQWMDRRISLMVKQLAFFIPIVVLIMIGLAWIINQKYTEMYKQELFNKLKLAVHTGSQMFDLQQIESIQKSSDFMNSTYRDIDRTNKFMLRGAPNLDTEALYSALYKVEADRIYVLMYFNTSVGTYYPIDKAAFHERVLRTGMIETVVSKEADGEWVFAIGPLYNREGKIVALHEVGTNLTNLSVLEQEIMDATIRIMQYVVPGIIVIYLLLTYYLLAPLRELRRKVSEVAEGNWDVEVEVRSSDEVADLGQRFNLMAQKIHSHIREVEQLSASYFRFVPQQFMNFLKKKSILDVQLGNHAQQEMTLMVFQIRDFYKLTSGMNAKQNFEFIKSVMGYFGPIIRGNNGFISNYLADGALALYTNTTDAAVYSAIDMLRSLPEFNQQLQEQCMPRIELSIAVHNGDLMLGIIGEEQRLAGSVISDEVNRLMLVQQQAATIGSHLLVTSQAFRKLQVPMQFKYRALGHVQLQGIDEPLELFDFFEGDGAEQSKRKQDTKEAFEQAIAWFQEGRYYDARKAFLSIIKQNRYDLTAKLYFYLCDLYFQQGSPDENVGVLTYDNRTK